MRRRSYCTRAPPIGPCEAEKMAIGLSWNTWFGGREPQSIAFFSAALSEKLYSGLAMSSPSAAATSARKRFADSGSPASNTSWLKIGMSSMRAWLIDMPAGMSSAQALSAAVLNDALRRLPLMPRILRSATWLSHWESREFTSARGGDAGRGNADAGGAAARAGAGACAARARPSRARGCAGGASRAYARAYAPRVRADAHARGAPRRAVIHLRP